MGVESANYKLALERNPNTVGAFLSQLGAIRVARPTGSELERWVLKGDRHWIDLMLIPGSLTPQPISVRVALCNPVEVESVLRQVLSDLVTEFDGRVYDEQTGQTYRVLNDENWCRLLAALSAKRKRFKEFFGDFEAAMSGDDVFPALNASRQRS